MVARYLIGIEIVCHPECPATSPRPAAATSICGIAVVRDRLSRRADRMAGLVRDWTPAVIIEVPN